MAVVPKKFNSINLFIDVNSITIIAIHTLCVYTPRTLRAYCSQSELTIFKIRESSARTLLLYNTGEIGLSSQILAKYLARTSGQIGHRLMLLRLAHYTRDFCRTFTGPLEATLFGQLEAVARICPVQVCYAVLSTRRDLIFAKMLCLYWPCQNINFNCPNIGQFLLWIALPTHYARVSVA